MTSHAARTGFPLSADAHHNGKHEALKDIYSLRTRFLGEHLGRWVGPFTAAVKAGAQSAYYRELAALTERFVRMEATDTRA